MRLFARVWACPLSSMEPRSLEKQQAAVEKDKALGRCSGRAHEFLESRCADKVYSCGTDRCGLVSFPKMLAATRGGAAPQGFKISRFHGEGFKVSGDVNVSRF